MIRVTSTQKRQKTLKFLVLVLCQLPIQTIMRVSNNYLKIFVYTKYKNGIFRGTPGFFCSKLSYFLEFFNFEGGASKRLSFFLEFLA